MYSAKILADSLSPDGIRLTTFEVTFPRFILAEVNTHRVFSRNSASSRAIPVKKSIQAVKDDPFIPESFVRNKAGMSGDADLEGWKTTAALATWHGAKWAAIGAATIMEKLELHKALANRLLEPFKWHTAIITSTEWENFFALRMDESAQPEFRKIATMMKHRMDSSIVEYLPYGCWHLPLVKPEEVISEAKFPSDLTGPVKIDWDHWIQISAGRCARVSLETHDGKRDTTKDVGLHDRLVVKGHFSPTEHQATPMQLKNPVSRANRYNWSGNFYGWEQYRKQIPHEDNFAEVDHG